MPNRLRLVVTDAAKADLAAILRHSRRQFGISQAAQYNTDLRSALKRLRNYPESAPLREDLSPNLRALLVHSHQIYYGVSATTISVRRILHNRQDESIVDWGSED